MGKVDYIKEQIEAMKGATDDVKAARLFWLAKHLKLTKAKNYSGMSAAERLDIAEYIAEYSRNEFVKEFNK